MPPSIREGALAVGASKFQSVFHHVVPLSVVIPEGLDALVPIGEVFTAYRSREQPAIRVATSADDLDGASAHTSLLAPYGPLFELFRERLVGLREHPLEASDIVNRPLCEIDPILPAFVSRSHE